MSVIFTGKERVLIIPDLQLPFEHQDSLAFLKAVKKKYKPTRIVQAGDYFDLHALSNYDPDPDGDSARVEIDKAIKKAREYYKVFPKVDMLRGNHDLRLYRKAYKSGIPSSLVVPIEEFMELPKGWKLHDHLEIDNVLYIHGEGFSGINGHRKAAVDNTQSTVIGHLHSSAGIAYLANNKQLWFGMNVGCLIDRDAYAFAYGRFHPAKPILCCGIVDRGIPQLVPMVLNKKSRWIKKLL